MTSTPQLNVLTEFANSFYDDWKDGGFTHLIPQLCYRACHRSMFVLNKRESAFLHDFYLLADLIGEE